MAKKIINNLVEKSIVVDMLLNLRSNYVYENAVCDEAIEIWEKYKNNIMFLESLERRYVERQKKYLGNDIG